MIELLALAFLFIFSGMFILKFLFFLLGLVFSGVGILIKIILTVVLGVVLFPVGAAVLGVVFSGGFLIVLAVFTGLAALIGEKRGHDF